MFFPLIHILGEKKVKCFYDNLHLFLHIISFTYQLMFLKTDLIKANKNHMITFLKDESKLAKKVL